MKDEAIAKINKFGKAGAVIANIVKVFMGIGIVGLIIGIVTIICLPKNIVTFETKGEAKVIVDVSGIKGVNITEEQAAKIEKEITEKKETININGVDFKPVSAEVNGNTINIESASDKATASLRSFLFPMFLGLLSLVVIYVTMIFTRRTMLALRDCETPFAANVIENLQKLGYSFIAWAIVPGMTSASFENILSGQQDYSFGINLENLLVVLIVNALVVIFRYGARLQQESDETL